jgi:ABC-2 type transport system permease protein
MQLTAGKAFTRASQARITLSVLGNETGKALLVARSRQGMLVIQFASLAAEYWVIQVIVGGGQIVHAIVARTLVSYMIYVTGYITIMRMANGVLEELNTGTFEQNMLVPVRPWILPAGRLAGCLAEGLGIAVAVGVPLTILLGADLTFQGPALVPVAISLADVGGFALLIGGLAIALKSIGSVIHVIGTIIMLLNGALIPVSFYPQWAQIVARAVPTTLGTEATHEIIISGRTLAGTWSDGTLPLALIHAAGLLLLGGTVYRVNIGRALRAGRLGPR